MRKTPRNGRVVAFDLQDVVVKIEPPTECRTWVTGPAARKFG
jgi:hypothetical protein